MWAWVAIAGFVAVNVTALLFLTISKRLEHAQYTVIWQDDQFQLGAYTGRVTRLDDETIVMESAGADPVVIERRAIRKVLAW